MSGVQREQILEQLETSAEQRTAEGYENWLTPKQVADYERTNVMTVSRRMKPGAKDFLVSVDRRKVDGRYGKLINPLSMSDLAQDRWKRDALKEAGQPPVIPAQPGLFPGDEIDKQFAALSIPRSEKNVMARRLRIVEQCLNHGPQSKGYDSLGKLQSDLALRNNTTKRSIQRWISRWLQDENLLDLRDGTPGPNRGAGTILDADMRAHLKDDYKLRKLLPQQCYRSLVKYLEAKQNSPGCKVDHLYRIPSRPTVSRYLRSLDSLDQAARQGPDALKAVCGHADRCYRGLHSLDRVDVDEWIVDIMAYDPKRVSRVGRYYLLHFMDERSRFPLVWSLVEHPNEQDEIDLLCRLIREYGVPGLINSDRGRFRGRTFGGRFLSRERSEMYAERDGMLDRLGIRRNLPREHNPRGSRQERSHLDLANGVRGLPGWCGRDTKERKMTDADARVARHREWVRTGQGEAPLLSRDQLLERINELMAEIRQRPSDGNGMDGFSPEAVFRRNTPVGGFRRITDEELAWNTAQHLQVKIKTGGIVQLFDGKRYEDNLLKLIQGQHREAVRLRHNHDFISVLPQTKGEEVIIAKRKGRVSCNDPDQLAAEMALQKRVRKLAGEITKPLDYRPQFTQPEPPKATQVIHPSEFFSAEEAQAPAPEQEISGAEFLMKYKGQKKREPMDFADLEG